MISFFIDFQNQNDEMLRIFRNEIRANEKKTSGYNLFKIIIQWIRFDSIGMFDSSKNEKKKKNIFNFLSQFCWFESIIFVFFDYSVAISFHVTLCTRFFFSFVFLFTNTFYFRFKRSNWNHCFYLSRNSIYFIFFRIQCTVFTFCLCS